MEDLNEILSFVTEEPAVIPEQGNSVAFPGCLVHSIVKLELHDGFELGDFMNESTVSVAQEVFAVDVSNATAAPEKALHAVWRVAMKTGTVALLRLRVTGKEDSISNAVVINGEGLVINDVELEPFVQAWMVEQARREAFLEIESVVKAAAALAKAGLSLFNATSEMAAQAAARLSLEPVSMPS